MNILDVNTLATVTGGVSKSSELAQSLTSIQSSLSNLASNKGNNNQSSNSLLLPVMMLALGRRQRATSVIQAGGATVVQG